MPQALERVTTATYRFEGFEVLGFFEIFKIHIFINYILLSSCFVTASLASPGPSELPANTLSSPKTLGTDSSLLDVRPP